MRNRICECQSAEQLETCEMTRDAAAASTGFLEARVVKGKVAQAPPIFHRHH
jgi:hypothetical protein